MHPFLSKSANVTIIHAFVNLKPDYCNVGYSPETSAECDCLLMKGYGTQGAHHTSALRYTLAARRLSSKALNGLGSDHLRVDLFVHAVMLYMTWFGLTERELLARQTL